MIKHLNAIKSSLIIAIILISSFTVFTAGIFKDSTVSARPMLLTFNSYIDIEYDPTPLNEDLAIDKSINVPLTIKYQTDIPPNFLPLISAFLWQFKNIILYGSMIGPMQKIHIEVVDQPEWADIYISQPDSYVNIPIGETTETITNLVISPREEAPAVPQSIVLKVSCLKIGRIKSIEFEETVSFTPSFVPTITISTDRPTRSVTPRENVEFKISIKNNANKKIRVEPILYNVSSEWNPTMNPPFNDIEPGGQEEFIYSIYTPYDFGWHNEIQSFQIGFTAKIFPLRPNTSVGGPYDIYLRVNNYGFSTPGFEVLTLLAAIVITGILIKKRYKM